MTSQNQSTVNPVLSPEWLRPFVFGGVSGVALVLMILFLIPSHPPAAKAQAQAPEKQEVAQVQPVMPTEIEERPLPKLSPKLPAGWSNLKPTPTPAKPAPAEKAEPADQEKPFVPNPPYQRPVRSSDWVDEALSTKSDE